MQGRLLELEGRLLEAAQAYERASGIDPDSPEVHRALARVYGRLSQPERAVEHARRALDLDPTDELSRRTLAGLYVATKQYEEATELLEPMFQQSTLSRDGLLVLLSLQIELGRSEDARRVAQKLLEPSDAEQGALPPARVYLAVAKAYERLGDLGEAESVYRRGLEAWPRARALYDGLADIRRELKDPVGELGILEEKLAALPGDPVALLRIAQIHESSGNRDAAIGALETLVRLHPEQVNARLQLGFFYYQGGRLDEATDEFRRLAEENPTLDEVRYFLGVVLRERGRNEEAIEQLRSVPPGSARFSESRVLLARILEEQERWKDALAEARSAVAGDPEATQIRVYLAGLLQRSGDLEAGVDAMNELIEADPDNPDLTYDLGVIYGEAKREGEALEWMDRTLKLDSKHAGALNYIGYTWAERGIRLDEAEDMIRQALEARPDDGYITDSLGWVLYKRGLQRLVAGEAEDARGDLAQAVRELERAMELTDPDDPVITRHLADAYRSVARLDEALATYRLALELGPKADEEADIRRQIELLQMQLQGVTSEAPH
jgi:tetratricopeptide (TPR) repeat protein